MSRRRKLAVGALVSALCAPGKVMAQTLEHIGIPPIPPPAPTGPAAAKAPAAPLAAFSASASALRDSLVALARAQIGRRYRMGGTSPESGFDCSGLVRYVMSALKVQLPRTANEQSRVGLAVQREPGRLRPGDLVTFGSTKRISHIGIYVGDGHFVHASTKAGKVIESPLIRPPNRQIKPWRGARRVIATGDSAVVVPGPKKG
ncbi:MAG TPA: C40 family peptidase [Gemmatimonadaceae bacterium]|nr:C40 family peptidase [Gemmatimonadaceae bacterium]